EQSSTTNEIARNVAEAARGSSEIAENIGSVAGAARATTEGAAAIQDVATGLAEVAEQLQSLVGSFEDAARLPMRSSGQWAYDSSTVQDEAKDHMAWSDGTR
ncbi:MAG: hypothetical protein HYR89_06645, partial [Actinobacteria bacterium]|nr:hypothetical protein [Actinomycetota bacterium]